MRIILQLGSSTKFKKADDVRNEIIRSLTEIFDSLFTYDVETVTVSQTGYITVRLHTKSKILDYPKGRHGVYL